MQYYSHPEHHHDIILEKISLSSCSVLSSVLGCGRRGIFYTQCISFVYHLVLVWVCVCVVIKFSSCTNAICLIKLVSTIESFRIRSPNTDSIHIMHAQINDRRMTAASQKPKTIAVLPLDLQSQLLKRV